MQSLVRERGLAETIATRASVRDFAATPVAGEFLLGILDAARQAPTSDNLQSYSIVEVRDADARRALLRLAGNQRHVAEAPVFLVICLDLHRLDLACGLHGVSVPRFDLDLFVAAAMDAAIVGQTIAVLAEDAGLGTVMIGAIRNDLEAVAAVLELPKRVVPLFGVCLGWPSEKPDPKPRLPFPAVVHVDRYDAAAVETELAAYDAREIVYRLGRGIRDGKTWSERVAATVEKLHRRGMAAALGRLGLSIDDADRVGEDLS